MYNELVLIALVILTVILIPIKSKFIKVLSPSYVFYLLLVVFLVNYSGLELLSDMFVIAFILICILYGISISRRAVYVLSLILLCIVPIAMIFSLTNIAEYLATIVFFTFSLGVIRDILYEKIFEN